MAVETTQPLVVQHWRFTVEDFHRMGELDILKEDDRVELLDGQIVAMNPIGPNHSGHVMRLNRDFGRLVGERALFSVQGPLELGPRVELYPDLILLLPRDDVYTRANPTPRECLLIIEVADSSLRYDREVKALVYAQAGIPELWIVDLVNEQILVYRDPSPEGYRLVQTFGRDGSIQPLAFPDLTLEVKAILG